MYMERMVIAVASGGPLETVENNVTGCLCDVNPTDWARALQRTVLHGDTAIEMGRNGRKRVVDLFSFDAFTRQLIDTVNNML
ncbi:hypothetical protein SARC_01983 [Sphaeroforma arctica JP610]|uniref:Glycosyl transferase family 1 domain-containing protein n=1 Tax=Sphaeroforma arctica JP610 TaxID=667725 RepID=A0A0L0G9X7_9EUKA|nr:hypothetical protein SARC_01983 [Sphaeroforma arctica JP610]KNC85837.1 hypothetical protein SARC_01983 [Sphaeroforma arctica JP610]|eukprot:XP_014159739.1 hypothetical protein SARC_01983 [Sphaeroforma arctica JP610]